MINSPRLFKASFLILFLYQPCWAESDQDILTSIQIRYDSVYTFKAHFVQKAYVKIMDQIQESKGTVSIKKPGKMKWIYKAPDPQILISNNKTLWLYVPEEKQATKASIEDIYTTNTPALFLSGKGKFADSFRIEKVTRAKEKITVILIPEKKEQGLDKLTLLADNKNYQILGSRVYDKLGNRTEIMFDQISVNIEIPDSQFEFQVPQGVDLMDTSVQP